MCLNSESTRTSPPPGMCLGGNWWTRRKPALTCGEHVKFCWDNNPRTKDPGAGRWLLNWTSNSNLSLCSVHFFIVYACSKTRTGHSWALRCLYLGHTVMLAAKPLFVFLYFAGHHLSCAEVEASQVHRVAEVSGQLRFASELLPWRTIGKKKK